MKLSPCPSLKTAAESFQAQVQRLKTSGFPSSILFEVAESLLTNSGQRVRTRETNQRPAVLPYIHQITHNLKKIASKYQVQVALSAPDKLRRLCPRINHLQPQQAECKVRHQQQYVDCQRGVVYEIPFTCGKIYVGQTGRCINERLREHALALRSSPAGHLAIHARDCMCSAVFSQTKILRRFRSKRTRELYEAQTIVSRGAVCVSAPSIALSPKELYYLNHMT